MSRILTIRNFILHKVFDDVAILIIHYFLCSTIIVTRGTSISQLRLILSVFLLVRVDAADMWLHLASIASVVLLDLNLTSYSTTADNLCCSGTIWQISDLSWGLASFSPHPLDLGNNFLVFTIWTCLITKDVFVCLFRLVGDLQFDWTIIWASSSTIGASTNASACLIIERCLSSWSVRHLRLSALGWISSTCHGPLRSILISISNPKLLKAII